MSDRYAMLDEILNSDGGIVYEDVEAYGKVVRVGTLSSAAMVNWIESQGDPTKSRFAGIRLMVLSLVIGPNNQRVSEDEVDAMVEVFKSKSSASNRAVIRAARRVNGLDELGVTTKKIQELKNASGEASTDASRSGSVSQ